MALASRTGVEVELLAPPGSDRRALAQEVASGCGGQVRRTWHTDSEPSLVPGMGHFWHLTQGFTAHDAAGALVATFVDDITITADLDAGAPPRPGWYRVLSDDARLLRLIAARTDPAAPLARVLDPVADLFGTQVEALGAVRRVRDAAGATIALATPLVNDRHRPCEVVTPPISTGHHARLEALLGPARALGFTIPVEAAVHLHVDGGPFRSASAFANLVRLFGHWRTHLRVALGTNPACTRLQPLPEALLDLVDHPDQADQGGTGPEDAWHRLQAAAATTGLTKYYDVNLTALLVDTPPRDTVEVRILPGALHAGDITARAELLEALLRRCRAGSALPAPAPCAVSAVAAAGDSRQAARDLLALAGS